LAIWLQFRYRNFLNSTFRTSATLWFILPKTILYQDKTRALSV
jgi:hypothetical protein